LSLERDLPVPVERVWRAFVDAGALAAWFWPPRFGTTVATANIVGGRYRIDGSAGGIAVSGEYLERQRPHLLAFTWRWDGDPERTVVNLRLRPAGDGAGAVLRLRHDGFADESTRDNHVQGWSDCLDRLRDWLARTGTDTGEPG